jgi:hypothetical protein
LAFSFGERREAVVKQVIGINLILGVWLLVLPFAFGYVTVAMWNDVVFGLVIVSCSWAVVAEVPGQALWGTCGILCGAWLMLSPFILKDGAEAFGDVIIGALVVVISSIETWRMMHGRTSTAQLGHRMSQTPVH